MKTPQTDGTARSRELARSALGDRDAFRRVYALSSGHLYAVILRIQRDRDLADDAPGPADLLERASDACQLGHCMEGLSAQQRQSAALAFFDGLSHAEVAGTLRGGARRRFEARLPGHPALRAAVARDGRAAVARPVQPVVLQTDRTLELWWAPAEGRPKSLGLIRGDGVTVLRPGGLKASGIDHLAVSVEPAGGSPAGQPTGPVVFYGKLAP